MGDKTQSLILWFDQLCNDDVGLVGGKNASLGEMYSELTAQGIRIPNGFAITSHAYREFVNNSGLAEIIKEQLEDLDVSDIKSLQKKGKAVREAFLKVELPEVLTKEIEKAYEDLSESYDLKDVDVAVRSSATAEDLPGASFAGEHDTYLNISGADNVIQATRKAMASLFTDRAISYRVDKGFGHFDIALSVGVQKMVRSDMASSGVMFTIDTETGFKDTVQISSSYGLGEMVVQGKVTPDEFIVFKPTLDQGFSSIIKRSLGAKKFKMVYTTSTKDPVKEVAVSVKERDIFTLNNEEILTLARWGVAIERHYSERAGKHMPMDMEWAKDGETDELFIVQARPETVQSEKEGFTRTEYKLTEEGEPIIEGISVGTKIVTGKARVVLSTAKLHEFEKGEILITQITDPDWEPIMKISAAIITEKGGRTSHAAIVSRELGIPAVIGTGNVLKKIKTGDMITVDCSSGVVGRVYKGELKFEESTYDIGEIPETKTPLSLNVGSPEGAFMHSFLPHHGVGLAREEFIIASHIRVHPLALLNYDNIEDTKLKKQIDEITKGYDDKVEFYVSKLAEGIAQIGAAFYPHQVIVRFSDFKTNEYATLLGGAEYEPDEENPMIGWRGASRYANPKFKPAFGLEVQAVKRVREIFGLDNVHTMIPFCRTPEEGQNVLNIMREFGLEKRDDGLKVYVMCEIPTNVIRADDFLDVFDGFSIGSNDLTQLTLGMDRDSALVAPISNENDPAVRSLVATAIAKCKERGKYIGFCGQAPSDYPDFLQFLISQNIDAVSLNPDAIVEMKFVVAEEEKRMKEEENKE
ncbi:MAG: phosphoenolpyruvate synthase [Candidatus Pacebacteria bacterium]|nr:phosphoenolpyruvate synthase [Candidatus Paceibacterota bacterium]